MKNYFLPVAVLAVSLSFSSCRSTQLPNDYMAYLAYKQQEQNNQQTQQFESQRLSKQEIKVDECILMSQEPSSNLRAYGEGVSYSESVAMETARMNAVSSMVEQIKSTIIGAREKYSQNANKNRATATEGKLDGLVRQFFAGSTGFHIIKTNLYSLSDGTIQCYVCIEQNMSKEKMADKLANMLSDEDILGIDFDKERFAESIREELDNYKKQELGY